MNVRHLWLGDFTWKEEMDDDQEAGPDAGALASDNEQSEAKAEGEKPESEAKTGAQDKAESESDAGDDAGDDEVEPDETDKSDDDEEDKPKKRRTPGSERWKRRAGALEAENAALRRSVSDGEITREMVEKEIGKPPKEEDFKSDYLAYERAMTAYELDSRQVARELRKNIEVAKHARNEALREAAYEHEERVAEFRAKVPDFDKTLREAATLKASPTVESLILESDKSAHLVYHLAKNPDRLDRLNRMNERDAAREIGRIESRLSLPSPKTETKASKPVVPPKGGASAPSQEARLKAYMDRIRAGGR